MAGLVSFLLAWQALLPIHPCSCPTPDPAVEREVWVMGTRMRVVVEEDAADPRGHARRAAEAVVIEVARLERLLSTWDAEGPMARVNRAPVGEPVVPPLELGRYLIEAETWAERTGRAFDPTVGALLSAWGVRGPARTPDEQDLTAARGAVGPEALSVNAATGAVVRRRASAWIDTGAFGKGVALRSAVRRLAKLDVSRVFIDLGGQIWAGAPAGHPWLVDVSHPGRRDEPVGRLVLQDVSVATSGTSERPRHILDPRTGTPSPPWGSVTVVSRDPVEADVLATALYVMGPAAGMAWTRAHPGVAVLFLEERAGGLIPTWSPAMEPWIDAAAWSDTATVP